MGSQCKMYKEITFLLTLFLLSTSTWVSCSEAPVEMKEENEIKEAETDKKVETETKKVLSTGAEEDQNEEEKAFQNQQEYEKMYRDMLKQDLPSEGKKGSPRTVLDSSNFEQTLKNGYTFVKFYAPWCGHCQEMAPDWNDLPNHFFENPIAGVDLTIAEVDCVDAPMTCIDEGVDGYPAIKLYKDGNVVTDYFFARSLDRMKRFLSDKLIDMDQIESNTIGVYTLNDLIFTKFIEKSDEVPVLVKYYVPWCEHCKAFQEVWDELVIKFLMEESEDIKFAEINCMDNDSLDTCTEEGVEGFPSVHLYEQGILEDVFDGEKTIDELANFVWQTVDPSRVESGDAMDEYMNLASLMGGGMGGETAGGEDEFEECDCSDPECDCSEEEEEFDEGDYIDEDEGEEEFEEEYEEGDEDEGEEYEENEEEYEEEEISEEEDDKTQSEDTVTNAEVLTQSLEGEELLKDELPESKKDEL